VNYRDLMLINDGSGEDFDRIRIPQANEGCGDHVASLDYDGNGNTDFVVLNGRDHYPGPVQLISFP
jgi:hypothetical protein